jgi:hypothetical protein
MPTFTFALGFGFTFIGFMLGGTRISYIRPLSRSLSLSRSRSRVWKRKSRSLRMSAVDSMESSGYTSCCCWAYACELGRRFLELV